jgi:hypothetical protein
MLKSAVECIESVPELKGHIKLDLADENESGADISFIIYTDLPLTWKLTDKVADVLYNCLEKFDPYITLHFDWIEIRKREG